jgi:uncharacterized Zn-binding protein involved in type VI secretion
MKTFHYMFIFSIILLILLSGCSGKPSIKNDFCGVHINYQFCRCAFHNEFCSNIGMSKSEANTYVYAEYDKWIESLNPTAETEKEKYGIIEEDGNLYLNSRPGEVLEIKTSDLPAWAQDQIATLGASIAVVGAPDTIVEGDSNVLLDGLAIARVGDGTAHGGSITEGSKNIFVNGKAVAIIGGFATDPTVSPGPVPSVGGPIVSNTN